MTSQIEVMPTRLYIRALVSGTADSAEVRIYQPDSLMGWHFRHVRTFPSLEGMALEGRNVRTSFARRLEQAKLREIRIHDLRHTYATLLLQARSRDLFPVAESACYCASRR